MHLLATDEGSYPCVLKGWEIKTLEIELADDHLVGWYRNPTGGDASLRVPYKGAQYDQSLYPDFIMFHQTDDGIRPSIIDPHSYHLADASAKLKGLADYTADHGDAFDRIHTVAEIEGQMLALDMKSQTVRVAVQKIKDGGVQELFQKHAGNYN